LILMVGYNLRFYRPLILIKDFLSQGLIGRVLFIQAEVGQYLPDWRSIDYRYSTSASKKLGGGVVLELSHEIDYARWLMGDVESVFAELGQLSDLEIDVEDTADIFLRFESGTFGNIHLNMVQKSASRSCRIVGTEGIIEWNGQNHCARLYSNRFEKWKNIYKSKKLDRNEMYKDEIVHFLECVERGIDPIVDGAEGRRTLEVILAAKKSNEKGCRIQI